MAVVFAQLITGGREPRRARAGWCRSATTTATPLPGVTHRRRRRRRPACNGVDNGRLDLRPRARAARHAARPLRPGRRGRHLLRARSRTRPAASSPCSAPWCAAGSASAAPRSAATKVGARRSPSATATSRRQFAAPGDDREIVHQRLPRPPAQAAARAGHDATRCTSRRTSWSPRCTTSRPRPTRPSRRARGSASWSPAPPGSRSRQTWHATQTIQMCREACGGAGYLAENRLPQPQGRHRRLHHLRGRQHRAAAAGRQGPAHRLPRRRSARWTAGARSASSPSRSARRCSSGRRRARSSQRLVDAVPGRDDEVPIARPRLAAQDVRGPREAPARRRGPAAAQGAATERTDPFDIFNDVQDHVLPTAAGAHRPGRAGGVRRRHRAAPTDPARRGAARHASATCTR